MEILDKTQKLELFKSLVELTDEQKLKWRAVTSFIFLVELPNYTIRILSVDEDDYPPYYVQLENNTARGERFPIYEQSVGETGEIPNIVGKLYDAAKRSAYDLANIASKIKDDLESFE